VERLGIFGGTFDPPHLGHLIAAEKVRELCKLDQILFIPVFAPPHKSGRAILSAGHRAEMTRLATLGNDRFAVSDIEIKREGNSYTIDTLEQLANQETELSLIIGYDQLAMFKTWRRYQDILALSHVIVVARSGSETLIDPDLLGRVLLIELPLIEIASTNIRERVREGRSIRYLVPEPVREYIAREELYM
jgi:nicotinate-nucleotide adenylyltransferase